METLGDSILKFVVSKHLYNLYPYSNEGHLSTLRSTLVSNKFLYERALISELPKFLITAPFFVRQCKFVLIVTLTTPSILGSPPNILPWTPKSLSAKRQGWRVMSKKMVADFVEALCAAFYLDGGLASAVKFLKQMGILPDHEDSNNKGGVVVTDDTSVACDASVAVGTDGWVLHSDADTPLFLEELESTLHYTFSRRDLLFQCLTHNSINTSPSYQRYFPPRLIS